MASILLQRGAPYPFKTPSQDCAIADFLRTGGNRLLIHVSDITTTEENAFRNGLITSGFLYHDGAMLWLFEFYNNKGSKIFTFDAPFDARLIPIDERQLHNIDNEHQRLLIDLHVIDDKKIVRALRAVTLSPALTLAFLSAVQEQLATSAGSQQMQSWMQQQPEQLAKTAKMETLGR